MVTTTTQTRHTIRQYRLRSPQPSLLGRDGDGEYVYFDSGDGILNCSSMHTSFLFAVDGDVYNVVGIIILLLIIIL